MSTLDLFSLKGKKGFITGAARGIGKCLADAFTEMGASIAIVDIDIAEAEKTAKNWPPVTQPTPSPSAAM